MPTALTTINVAKEQAATYQPLLLAEFTFADGAVLRLSTHPLNTTEGGAQYGGNDYLGRISEQTIQQVQALSESGVDLVPSVTLSIADPASYIYANWETAAGRGFRGASLTLRLVFYDAVGNTFSSDSRIPFVGICEKPASDAAKLTVTAVAKTSLMRTLLPIVPIQRRCPWINPTTTAQRAEASAEDSCFYECGETRSLVAAPPCSYTRATCTQLNRFGGITYTAPAGMRVREYVSGNWSDVRGLTNEAAYGDRIPMLYGQAWIEPPVLTAIPDGNYLRGECIVCLGQCTISKVLVNGVELSPANEADGTPIVGANPDFRYNWINDGTRDGSPNLDTPWSGTGDPYGSMSAIMFCLPRSQGGGDGVPRVRVLAKRKELRKYQALASITVTANVAVATLVGANVDIASNDPAWSFEIYGTNGTTINAVWAGLTNWTTGPPGTFTFATTGVANGTYTGGYIRFKSNTENAAWIIADLLTWTNYAYADLDIASFCAAAQVLESRPSAFVLRQRRSAAEIIRSLRQAHGLLLVPEHLTGKLHLYVKQTLADQQPATISGSNYDTAVSSKTAAGVVTNGYMAYRFDAASILRSDLPISLKELSRASADSPNRLSVTFQDRTNDYATSNLSVVDSDDAGRLEGQEIAGGLAATPDGLTSYADAMRAARVSMAEIHRGNTAADTRGTRVFEWDTTVRGSHLRVGHIVLLTDTLKGLTNQMLRITKIQPAQNYETVKLTAHWHDDNWYTDAYALTGALDASQYTPNPVSDASPLDLAGTVGSNILKNPGFENGKANWHGDIDIAGVNVVTDTKDTGMACLKITATGATEVHQPYDFEDGKYNIMTCVPGEAFSFKGRYKFDAASTATTAQARIAFYQANGTFISAATATLDPANTAWTDFSLTATAPALSKYMGIFPWFGTLTAGAVYLDTLYAEKTVSSAIAPGHVTGLAVTLEGGVTTLRGQKLTNYVVTGLAPVAASFNGFNQVYCYHTDSNGVETAYGPLPAAVAAGAAWEVSFERNVAPAAVIGESVKVVAASPWAKANYATAPVWSGNVNGMSETAGQPSGVTLTVLAGELETYALKTDWTPPSPIGGVVEYEIRWEFYSDSGGVTKVGDSTPGHVGDAATASHTSDYTPKPVDPRWVKAFVRSWNAYKQHSVESTSSIVPISVNLSAEVNVPQPAVGDWALGTVTYGANEKVQRAGLPVNVIAIPAGADYVTAWLYIDGQYRDVMSTATLGLNYIWIDQPRTATNYNCKLVGNRYDAVKQPSAANDVKTFSVAAWALPLQASTFAVAVEESVNHAGNGKTLCRYKFTITAPADPNRMGFAVDGRWTNSSYVPLASPAGDYVETAWIKTTENSVVFYTSDTYDWARPKSVSEYHKFRLVPKNYANEENLTGALEVNFELTSDGGLKTTAIDPSTIGKGLNLTASGLASTSRGLLNGDFEAGLTEWTADAGWSVNSTDQKTGSYCAEGTASSIARTLSQPLPCSPDQQFRVQFYARESANGPVQFGLNWNNEAWTGFVAGPSVIISGDSWLLYEVAGVAPADVTRAVIYAYIDATATTGRVLLDQVQLIPVEPLGSGVVRTADGVSSTSRDLKNIDFEDVNPDGTFADWNVTAGVTVNTADKYSGTNCAQIAAAIGVYRSIAQQIPAVPGRQFRWQAYCRETVDGSGGYLAITFYNAADGVISNALTTISGDTWTAYEVVGTAPALTAKAQFEVIVGNDSTTGRVLVDQCQLIAVEPTGTGVVRDNDGVHTSERTLKNGNFADALKDWTATAQWAADTAEAYDGTAAKCTCNSSDQSIYQALPVVPGQVVQFEAYLKESGNSTSSMALRWHNAAGAYISEAPATITGDAYALYRVVGTAPALAASVRCQITVPAANTSGRVMFDNANAKYLEPTGSGLTRTSAGIVPDVNTSGPLLVDGGGKLTAYGLTELARYNISADHFEASGGYLVLKAAVIDWLLARSVTITSDLTITRSSSGGVVAVNGDGVEIKKGTNSVKAQATGVLFTDGTNNASVAVVGTLGYCIAIAGIYFASGSYMTASIFASGASTVVLTSPSTWRTALELGTIATKNVGVTGSFTTVDGKTVTVTDGIITAIV